MSRINILGMKILLLGVLVHSYLCSIYVIRLFIPLHFVFFKARVNINQKVKVKKTFNTSIPLCLNYYMCQEVPRLITSLGIFFFIGAEAVVAALSPLSPGCFRHSDITNHQVSSEGK